MADLDDGSDLSNPIEAAAMVPPSKMNPVTFLEVAKRWHSVDMDHSREWRGHAREWFAFRAGHQWTEADRRMLEGSDRPVITFNRVLTIMKAVAGMEINGRHEINFSPRNVEDTKPNEIINGASRWMEDGTDGEDEESEAFDNCATCGMGWVENRMDYESDPAGMYVEESMDPLEMGWDRSARKKNLKDARRIHRSRRIAYADARAMFPDKTREQLDAVWADDGIYGGEIRSIEQKRRREPNVIGEPYDDLDEVTIVQMQWWEREHYWIVADVATNQKIELSDAEFQTLKKRMEMLGIPLHAARMTRKVYKQAWIGNELLAPISPAPIPNKFSWDCVTGEFDKSKRTWFGLVKVMRDPQMWANKWLSQILHILNSTAKGGILAETSAFEDEREAEETYARQDSITWLADGALSGDKPKVMPKPGAGMVEGYVGLMTFAISSIKDVTGINLELLGQQDQNQPGILEAMRKQAGMTVLATLFDSLRRFRKGVGRSRLFFIQNFLSDGRIIRIVGSDGDPATVRLAKEKTTGEYDVVVGDTPTSPNQKEANWAIIQPLLVVFKEQLMAHPEIFLMLLEYSPLPSKIIDNLKRFMTAQQNDPQKAQEAQRMKELGVAKVVAEIEKDQSTANLNNAKAGGAQASAMWDIAMARNLLEDNKREELRSLFDHWEGQAKMVKAQADAETASAKAQRERVGARLDVASATTERMNAQARMTDAETKSRGALVGAWIDQMAAVSGAERNMAAAHKDRVTAQREASTPVGTAAAPQQ